MHWWHLLATYSEWRFRSIAEQLKRQQVWNNDIQRGIDVIADDLQRLPALEETIIAIETKLDMLIGSGGYERSDLLAKWLYWRVQLLYCTWDLEYQHFLASSQFESGFFVAADHPLLCPKNPRCWFARWIWVVMHTWGSETHNISDVSLSLVGIPYTFVP
jgi:hypothetical protein